MNSNADIASNAVHERDEALCFEMGGILFVPHHFRDGVFVGPGGIERTSSELLKARAKKRFEFLWPRRWQRGRRR